MSEFSIRKEPAGVAIHRGSARVGRVLSHRQATSMIEHYRRGRWAALHNIAMTCDKPDCDTAAVLRDWCQLEKGARA